jgi:hypothetical protein
LVSLSDAQGISHQQYAVSSANKLGDFLSDILNNMQMSLSSMGSGKPKPGSGEVQLPDIIKSSRVLVIKLKRMEGQKAGEGKTENLGIETKKERMVFKMEVWEKSMRRLCWRYTRNKQLHEALENELNKQGLGGSGQNALER